MSSTDDGLVVKKLCRNTTITRLTDMFTFRTWFYSFKSSKVIQSPILTSITGYH